MPASVKYDGRVENRYPAKPWDWFKGVFFPPKCLCCERRVPPDRLFCPACLRGLPQEPERRIIRLDNGIEVPVLSPLKYGGGYRETMLLYKFEGHGAMALRIGMPMAWLVRELPERDWVVSYVPLSWEGLKDRGYDQSELLAWQVSRRNGFETKRLLDKVKKTKTQHDLGLEERLTNQIGAYKASDQAAGMDILLVDDIVTSGSTLKECAAVLFEAGARSVACLCAADAGGSRGEEN